MPGVVAGEAEAPQVVGVGRAFALVGEGRVIRVDPVIAVVGLEAGFGEGRAARASRIDAEPPHAFQVGRGVGLADQRGADSRGAQVVAQGQLLQRQRHRVPGHLVAADVAPGVRGHPRRPADGALGIGTGEAHALRGQAVDVRRVQIGMAVAGQVIATQLVAHDVEDVADRLGLAHDGSRKGNDASFRGPPRPAASAFGT